MQIDFESERLRKLCNDQPKLQRKYGKKADFIRRRLDDLADIGNLSEVTSLPGSHHELIGNKKGLWSCTTLSQWRIIYRPQVIPIRIDENGKYLLTNITAILIVDVNHDYHGK